ncbi:MAG: ATP synthase F1 subunit delta [Ruminococcaceae bacterium]|nr:ATP synthase F1 subunit delta [Oscillospiraceae bacterium]
MSESAGVYAKSLYSLSAEEDITVALLEEMDMARDIFHSEPDFVDLLAMPSLSKEERTGMLDACFRGRVHPYLLNFLKILTERGLIRQFAKCCQVYRECYNEDSGILDVSIVSAVALTEEQKSALKEKLDRRTGKNVRLCCKIDPDCIGGILVDYQDKRIDGTVSGRLSAMAEQLKNTAF